MLTRWAEVLVQTVRHVFQKGSGGRTPLPAQGGRYHGLFVALFLTLCLKLLPGVLSRSFFFTAVHLQQVRFSPPPLFFSQQEPATGDVTLIIKASRSTQNPARTKLTPTYLLRSQVSSDSVALATQIALHSLSYRCCLFWIWGSPSLCTQLPNCQAVFGFSLSEILLLAQLLGQYRIFCF